MLRRLLHHGFVLVLSLSAIALSGAGCRSTESSATGPIASVEILGNTPGQIRQVATQVFQEHGYLAIAGAFPGMIFEKEGSKLDSVAYGGLLESVWIRAEVSTVPVAEGTFRLQCQVHLLQGRGTLEEEVKHPYVGSGPYQKLLDEVASRLRQGH